MRKLRFTDGAEVPVLGQGTWHMGERGADRAAEAAALRLGLDLGLTLIDTAEMYAGGGAEEVVAAALEGRRDEAFLVSKVVPSNADRRRLPRACEASLRRLRTDRLDLFLLHWPGSVPLDETVEAMQALVASGKIRRWGVSNFDPAGLDAVRRAGADCATDQLLYNLSARGIEFDLLPRCRALSIPVMAYTPLGQAGRLLENGALGRVAARHATRPAVVALAWTIRAPGVIAIPKAADPAHLRANLAASELVLTETDLAELDAAFPPPRSRRPLEML